MFVFFVEIHQKAESVLHLIFYNIQPRIDDFLPLSISYNLNTKRNERGMEYVRTKNRHDNGCFKGTREGFGYEVC